MAAAPKKKVAVPKAVDDTVKNQENPVTSEEDRSTENSNPDTPVAKMAPANEVDITVVNQENLGAGEVVDRNPGPQLVEDSVTGATYDVSKADRELVDPDQEENEARRARLRQTEGVMNAKDMETVDPVEDREEVSKIKIEFLESGLTAERKVWKKGEILELEDVDSVRNYNKDSNDEVWYELTAAQQKDKYGKVFFEKR